jgi:hypothetical protein
MSWINYLGQDFNRIESKLAELHYQLEKGPEPVELSIRVTHKNPPCPTFAG